MERFSAFAMLRLPHNRQ